jgi:3-dehydroquinate synthase
MVIIARGVYKSGLVKEDISPRIIDILKKYNLPTETDYSADELFSAAGSDKKCDGDSITLVIPETVGKCKLYKTEFQDFYDILEKGLK